MQNNGFRIQRVGNIVVLCRGDGGLEASGLAAGRGEIGETLEDILAAGMTDTAEQIHDLVCETIQPGDMPLDPSTGKVSTSSILFKAGEVLATMGEEARRLKAQRDALMAARARVAA